jgi:hypothetical protein
MFSESLAGSLSLRRASLEAVWRHTATRPSSQLAGRNLTPSSAPSLIDGARSLVWLTLYEAVPTPTWKLRPQLPYTDQAGLKA